MKTNKAEILGRRLKFFRQRAGLSQFDLESSIDISIGSLSKIEHGIVNPTKETILDIAHELRLHYREVDYLIGLTSKPADKEEIQKAKEEVKEYLNSNVSAYLIDDRWRLFAVSKRFLKFLNLTQEYIDSVEGTSSIEFMVDPSLGVSKIFTQEKMPEMMRENLNYFYKEVGFMHDDEYFLKAVKAINQNPMSKNIWSEVTENYKNEYSIRRGRVVYYNIYGIDIPFTYHYEPLLHSYRFQLVVWTPQNKFLKYLSKIV